jgi:cysteine-rich repeat protein
MLYLRTYPRVELPVFLLAMLFWSSSSTVVLGQYVATTTVSLTVCGDGIVAGLEVCDDGLNTGFYANSILGKNCKNNCSGYGPYCGDYVSDLFYGEQCDDGNNIAGDLCNAVCQNEVPPVIEGGGGTGGGSGGGGGRNGGGGSAGIPGASTDGGVDFEGATEVSISGIAYPNATVNILRDGSAVRIVEANADGEFTLSLANQTPGVTTYGFWATDSESRRSITYSATFQVIQNAVTSLRGILIPPTLAVVPERVAPGGEVVLEGSSAPNARVQAYVGSNETPEVALALGTGVWSTTFNTGTLEAERFHTVRANYIYGDPELTSGFSQLVSFYVGNRDAGAPITADLNADGFVNLTDFSILLFNWNSTSPFADLNQDGTVSLPDFSIMLFYWTG